MSYLSKRKGAIVMTVKRKAAPAARKAAAHQRLLDDAARAESRDGIRQGLKDSMEGRIRPARQFFEEFESSHTQLR